MPKFKRLPIIILLESHVDYVVPACLRKLLPLLIARGYNKLCLESPSSMPITVFKNYMNEGIKLSLQGFPAILREININYGKAHPGNSHTFSIESFLNLSYAELQETLNNYYLGKNASNNELFSLVNSIRGHIPNKVMLQYLNEISDKISICGIDIDAQFDPLFYEEHNEQRENQMVSKLQEYYNNNENIIFKVGAIHVFGLLKRLAAANLLNQTIFIYMSSPDTIPIPLTQAEQAVMKDPLNPIYSIRFESDTSIQSQWDQIQSIIGTNILPALGIAIDLLPTLRDSFYTPYTSTKMSQRLS